MRAIIRNGRHRLKLSLKKKKKKKATFMGGLRV